MTEWLTIQQAMLRVGVSRRTLYNWMQDGKLVVCRTAGERLRIEATSLFRTVDGKHLTRPPADEADG